MTKKTQQQITEAIKVLRQGGTVVFPTETSYGLAADATDRQAVERLMRIKGRGSRTLPVIVSGLAMVKRYVRIRGLALKLAREFWPGALTMVLPVRSGGNDARKGVRRKDTLAGVSPFCVKDKQIAIRVSSNEIARELSRQLGKPIVATSANKSGQPDCYSVRAVRRQYARSKLQPDYILDAGALPERRPSTLIRVNNGQVEVIRQGSINIRNSYRFVNS